MNRIASNQGELALTALGLHCAELFAEVPCWISIQDRQFRIVKATAKMVSDFGEHREGKCYAIYKGRSEPCAECPVARTFEDGKDHGSQEVLFDKRGLPHNLLVNTRPLRNSDGVIVAVIKVFADVSSEKELAGRLHDSLLRFRNIFDNAPCFITVQDRNLRITESNLRFDESFGDGTGEHCYEVYKKRQDPCPQCPVAETFRDGQVHTSEEVVVDNQGRSVHVLVYTAPIRNAAGDITSVMEMSTDVTEIRTLQNKLASLGQLVGGIAHNAKNILDGLRGGVYILNLGFRDNKQDDIRTGWEMVQRNVERLSAMIMDMLSCARERTPQQTPISLAKMVKEVVALYTPRILQFHINLETAIDEQVEILGDAKEIHSLISNLITNAIEACNADRDEQKTQRIVVRVTRDKGAAIIEIEDNGAGMDPATRNALFQRLVSTKGSAGTGLGLVMSQKVATEHGGSISVRSEPGTGSVFTVRLPARQTDAISA
jgi:PAS domain S-box-containing protein